MARTESRTKTGIWRDADFIRLSARAQRMYWLLYSQPTITLCGVVAYTPTRWAGFASDETVETVMLALAELEDARFIISDPSTEEVMVRTFMRGDGISPANQKIWRPALAQAEAIVSPRIRQAVAAEMARIEGNEAPPTPDLDTPSHGVSDTPCDTPFHVQNESEDGLSDGVSDGVPDRPRTRVRAAPSPIPVPTPVPSVAAPTSSTRPPDRLFEAVADACGYPWGDRKAQLTKSARGELNRGVSQLREIGVQPEEVAVRVGRYRRRFPGMEVTAVALAKHWHRLDAEPVAPTQPNRQPVGDRNTERIRRIVSEMSSPLPTAPKLGA